MLICLELNWFHLPPSLTPGALGRINIYLVQWLPFDLYCLKGIGKQFNKALTSES